MAASRLERIGTIFSRTTGLLQTGAMKLDDKPIWYDVYAVHPPDREPRFDREPPQTEVRDIFYEEDAVRAKFHQSKTYVGNYNLTDTLHQTRTQEFIEIYKKLKAEGPLDEGKILEVALEQFQAKRQEDHIRDEPMPAVSLLADFKKELENKKEQPLGLRIADIYKDDTK